MADYGVIAATSQTLQAVLANALSTLVPAPVTEVHDLQGNISTNPARLTIFLFDAAEDPSARNRPRVQGISSDGQTARKPPMALVLRYLLTPWSGERLTDQLILGRAMQVLYDGATLSGADLMGSLAGSTDALKITLAPLNLEERTRVWHAVNKPYRLSLSYEVRVVNLHPETGDELHSVSRRTLGYSRAEAVS